MTTVPRSALTRLAAPLAAALAALALASPAARAGEKAAADLVPITTSSDEARALYLEARALTEALRGNDARPKAEAAMAKDPEFATAQFLLATVSPTAQGFFDGMKKAATLAGATKVSQGERDAILGSYEGNVRGDSKAALDHYEKLAAAYPRDPRALAPLAGFRMARQEWQAAADLYKRTLALDPGYAPSWNQIGYALRFLGRYNEAEEAFAKYVAAIPNDPNPYDSQGEFLLKVGKFEKSIASYRKALAIDAHFIPSYVGIANAQMGLERYDDARATLASLRGAARTDADVRASVFWTMITWLHQGEVDRALAAYQQCLAISGNGDPANHAGDLQVIGQIQLDARRFEPALATFAKAVETVDGAAVPEETKDGFRRNHLFFVGRTAAANGDLAAARTNADAYRARATAKGLPFEVRRSHELDGLVALGEKDWKKAIAELAQADDQDPYVWTLRARAQEGAGNAREAREAWRRAADYNEIVNPLSWAFVRAEARKALKSLPKA